MNAKQIKEIQDRGIATALIQAVHTCLSNTTYCVNRIDTCLCQNKPADKIFEELKKAEALLSDVRTLIGVLKNKGELE